MIAGTQRWNASKQLAPLPIDQLATSTTVFPSFCLSFYHNSFWLDDPSPSSNLYIQTRHEIRYHFVVLNPRWYLVVHVGLTTFAIWPSEVSQYSINYFVDFLTSKKKGFPLVLLQYALPVGWLEFVPQPQVWRSKLSGQAQLLSSPFFSPQIGFTIQFKYARLSLWFFLQISHSLRSSSIDNS
jgi:hypothetical protein